MKNSCDVVISGMAGRFPECNNVDEFKEAIFNGLNLATKDNRRFSAAVKGIPHWMGLIPELDKFDAQFFDIHNKQANVADPRHRILLETVQEAIIDAGFNPVELRGSKTGVFVGLGIYTSLDEIRSEGLNGYINLGIGIYAAANRISRAFDFKGPSMSLDTACSSSMYAMVEAFEKIKSGEIENAIACGTHTLLHPDDNMEYKKLQVLTEERFTRVFSSKRDGFVRSEAVCCVFMQRKPNSRRIYATVLGAKTNANGYNEEGFTYPGREGQLSLARDIFSQYNINPDEVKYVELHGTGTVRGDFNECETIYRMFFDKNRDKPLLIGSVKSNTGHCEQSAAIVGAIKVILSMETGVIPGNINAEPIDKSLMGVTEGKLKVLTKNTKWEAGIVGINSFGIGGSNGHMVLKCHDMVVKPKVNRKNRLVQISGRTEEAVSYFLNEIEKNKNDEEFLALLDAIHKFNVDKHNFRGYSVVGQLKPKRNIKKIKPEKRPIVFIYSGISTQWPGMGRDLMHFEVYRNTFNRCAEAVEPFKMNLKDIIMNGSEEALSDIGNTFVAIASIQIALTDLLLSLDIKPDFFAGHSSGEVGCAYANGDLTPEQAVLLAYARGFAIKQESTILGQMASVGLSEEEIQSILPKGIFVACHNAKTNVTISGPAEATKEFVEKLKNQEIYAQLINSAGKAFHSEYISDCYDHLLNFCQKIIPHPNSRSDKWISSSIPADKVDENWTKYNCAEYQANNFRNKVLFDRIYDRIPPNAIVVEIAPNGIFQGILKRELGPETTVISLTKKTAEDHEQFILSAIGELFIAGAQPNLRNLYKETVFPVSRGTKMIGPLVKWDHSVSWFVPFWKNKDCFGKIVKVNLAEESNSYLKGHNIDGRVLIPAYSYVEIVWKVFADQMLKDHTEVPIVFEDLKFIRATIISETEPLEFLVNIMKQTGYFEIYEGGSVVASGRIRSPKNVNEEYKSSTALFKNTDNIEMCNGVDFYKDSKLRRMNYSGVFQGIVECDIYGYHGTVEWKNNYSGFLDSISQMTMCENYTNNLILPKSVKKLVIDPLTHNKQVSENKYVKVERESYLRIIKTKAIEVLGLEYDVAPKREKMQNEPVLETYNFVPYDSFLDLKQDLDTSFRIALQIIIQNTSGLMKSISVCNIDEKEVQGGKEISELRKQFVDIITKQISANIEYTSKAFDEIKIPFDVLILSETVFNKWGLERILKSLRDDGGFVIYFGQMPKNECTELEIVFKSPTLLLLKSKVEFPVLHDIIKVENSDFSWLDKIIKVTRKDANHVCFLLSRGDEISGILGLLHCLLTENTHVQFKAVFLYDNEDFSLNNPFHKLQLGKLLTVNVLKDNQWGTFVHLPLEIVKQKELTQATLSLQNSSFHWLQTPSIVLDDKTNSELVNVHYSALNPLDNLIFNTNVRLPIINPSDSDTDMGFEYSGTTESGKRVMGIVSRRGLSLQIATDADLTWEVPTSWTLEEAATVPVVYSLCYYSIIMQGKLEKGEILLIYATMEFAAVVEAVARSFNAASFIIVQSQKELEFFKKSLPNVDTGLADDSLFMDLIMEKTGNNGVDLVVSMYDDIFFERSLKLLSPSGRVLNCNKVSSSEYVHVNHKLLHEISYQCVSLDVLLKQKSHTKRKLRNVVQQGISSGVVVPLPSKTFQKFDVSSAFKFLEANINREKVLIRIINYEESPILVEPKIYFNPNKSYIIVGGLGGMGLELADWMIRKGATKLILNARRNVWNGYQLICMKKWSHFKDIVINVDTNDATTLNGAEKLIKESQKLAPLGGVFNLAMVLQDNNLIDQTVEDFEAVIKPKQILSENLDKLTRKNCPFLDYFVLFSSHTSGRGNLGQTNYGWANSAMEMLCEKRRKYKIPGLAIQWGPVADVGALSSLSDQQEFLHKIPQKISSCFDALEKFMLQDVIVGASTVISDKKKISEATISKSPASVVANILGIQNLDSIDTSRRLFEFGLDSLMITEIKQSLYRNFKLELGLDEIKNIPFDYLFSVEINPTKYNLSSQHSASEKLLSRFLDNPSIVKINESERNDKPCIFILPPIEGYVDCLLPLAKHFNTTVYGLQCSKKTDYTKVEKTAKCFKDLIKSIQTDGLYLICGYSYGSVIGFEIGLQLEKEGHEVRMIMIDGSPDYTRVLIDDLLQLHHKVLSTFSTFFNQVDQEKVEAALKKFATIEDSLNSISQIIAQASQLKLEDVKVATENYWNRCNACYLYKPSQKLKAKILLARRKDCSHFKRDDYNIQDHCEQEVNVKILDGNHYTILTGDNLVELFNTITNWIEKYVTNL